MKLTMGEVAQAESDPNLKGLNDELKSPEKFKEIEEKLKKIMLSDHKHRLVRAFVNCKRCKKKVEKRKNYLRELGFKNYEQYVKYRRVMDIITKKKDLVL